jgi:hypothetical protein
MARPTKSKKTAAKKEPKPAAKAKAVSRAAPKPAALPEHGIVVGKSTKFEVLDLHFGNRHGLVTGATGTGKTVTLQVLAEGFASNGVPVFAADIKGDLSGISQAGGANPKVAERVTALGLTAFEYSGCPVTFWDIFGEQGHPVRATISEMGPLLLGRLLGLNDTQAGVLTLVFRVADDNGMLLLDLQDLRAMVQYVGDNAATFRTQYGKRFAGKHRRHSAPASASRRDRRRAPIRRTRTQPRRPDPDRRAGPRRHQHPRRRQAAAYADAVHDVPTLAARRTV